MVNLKDLVPKDRPTFYVMVGIAGAGKSTAVKKIQSKDSSAVVVCPDEYRKQLGGTYKHFDDDNRIFKQICPKDVKSAIEDGKSVIFDATNISKKRRRSALAYVNGFDVNKIAVVVSVDLNVALKQNRMRDPDKIVPDHIIHTMFKSFVYPTKDEGFDKIIPAEKL